MYKFFLWDKVKVNKLSRFGGSARGSATKPNSCDTVHQGYQCDPDISHSWGQYSAYFNVPTEISSDVPPGCHITFAQILSRHGGRDPTQGKSTLYAEIIHKIKSHVQEFRGDFAFLADYSYTLGADKLTAFGAQQMVNSGTAFFTRYKALGLQSVPFVRASGQERIIDSAERFDHGFHQAKIFAGSSEDKQYPYDIIIIPEEPGSNNTLDHGLCTAFEETNHNVSRVAQNTFISTFIPSITDRLNTALTGANLTDQESIFLMDLCPFETIASITGSPSQFCNLFSQVEWKKYDYHQTLGKYYSYGPGNPLGPTQGTGYVNELVARLTGKAVRDHTSVNQTLDSDPTTFPLDKTLYADFTHDNDMTAVFAALGLYSNTPKLSTSDMMTVEDMKGYSAAWTVPFAARAFIEKMNCDGAGEEMVRVLVNGRVIPLEMCGGDELGRCGIGAFVEGLTFAREGGRWNMCFIDDAGENASGKGGPEVS